MHAGSARQPVEPESASPEVVMDVAALSPDVRSVTSGIGFYNHRILYQHLDPLLEPGPIALSDGNCMFDSVRLLLKENNIVRTDGREWDVPSLRMIAVQTARREWEGTQGNDREKRRLEGKLMSIIERQNSITGSGRMDIEEYFRRMQVPCDPAKYNVRVPRGMSGLWGDSHMLHCLADALCIIIVSVTLGNERRAWILGPRPTDNTASEAPRCIIYLQHDGLSHYDTLVPKDGDGADQVVRKAMAGDLKELEAGTAGAAGASLHAKTTRASTRSRLR